MATLAAGNGVPDQAIIRAPMTTVVIPSLMEMCFDAYKILHYRVASPGSNR